MQDLQPQLQGREQGLRCVGQEGVLHWWEVQELHAAQVQENLQAVLTNKCIFLCKIYNSR